VCPPFFFSTQPTLPPLSFKIGVLGANGAGKSTLLKILAGVDDAFDGRRIVADGIKVSFLEQEPRLDDGPTVDDNIRPALAATQALLDEFEAVSSAMAAPDADVDSLMKKMDTLQTKLDACGGWELDRMLARATDALRCPPGDALVANLSGGERRRVALARVLLENPDVLILDEPTNHLDAASVAWLERTLADFPGTVVAVTHDRYFLDNVAGWILELDRGKGLPFEGNYSSWLESKAARREGDARAAAAAQRAVDAELEFVRSNAKGQTKKGKARMRRYEELVEAAESAARSASGGGPSIDAITIPPGPRLGDIVVEADALSKAFGGRVLVDGLSFSVPPGAIVGIVGANGAGKSTLFRMITGSDAPDGGNLRIGETVVPMYVDQDRDGLDAAATVAEAIGNGADFLSIAGRDVPVRQYASLFNFKGGDQQKKVGALSGGERNRLHLARALATPGNLLLLDEPQNDADLDLVRALESALLAFPGSAMVISHDRFFLDRVATHILAFEGDSQAVWFEGSFSEYDQDWRKRNGGADPTRIKYRKMATV
jgi:energy-dependent translational throttle protein EttA